MCNRLAAPLGWALVLAVLLPAGCGDSGGALTGPGGTTGSPLYLEVAHGGMQNDVNRLFLEGVKVRETSNSADVTYHTTLNVGPASKLVVYPAGGGDPVELTGQPLRATYYHHGRVLAVYEGGQASSESADNVHSFVNPVRWSTVAR